MNNDAGFLIDPGETLVRNPPNNIVTVSKPLLRTEPQRQSSSEIEDRYLNLDLSEVSRANW